MAESGRINSLEERKALTSCCGYLWIPGSKGKDDYLNILPDSPRILFELSCSKDSLYNLTGRHAEDGRVLLAIRLNDVDYEVKSETWHEIRVKDNRRFAIQFEQCEEQKEFIGVVQEVIYVITLNKNSTKKKRYHPGHHSWIETLDNEAPLHDDARLRSLSLPNLDTTHLDEPFEAAGAPFVVKPLSGWLQADQEAEVEDNKKIIGSQLKETMRPKKGTDNLIESLQLAIAIGDEDQAKTVAALLAKKKAAIDVKLDSNPTLTKGDAIMVKVFIEDRTNSCGISLKVKPSAKIRDLKLKMLQEYGFAPEIQKWIVGKKLPSDNETLSKLGVKTPESPLFLYLLPAKDVNLSKEEFLRNYGWDTPNEVLEKHFQGMHVEGDQDYMSMHGLPRSQSAASGVSSTGRDSVAAPSPASRVPPIDVGGEEVYQMPRLTVHGSRDDLAAGAELQDLEENTTISSGEGPFGWECPQCTFINVPTRPGCAICSGARPEDYEPPVNYQPSGDEQQRLIRLTAEENEAELMRNTERQRLQIQSLENFARLVQAENQELVPNIEVFDCPICFETIEPGEGVILRECLHMFCKVCLSDAVRYNEDPVIKCPFVDGNVSCLEIIQEREIKALVTPEIYQKYLQRGLATAEHQAENSYHCKTSNCVGWCIYEDAVNTFNCPVCAKPNCLTCKAIHEGQDCKEYQEDLNIRSSNDEAAKKTKEMLDRLVSSGEAMHCPRCKVILQKKEGCDWLKCSMCQLEVCWVTKQARWGPQGPGDTSGGCRCRVGGKQCHPNCGNCH